MELFYSRNIANGVCQLDLEESRHCAKVLRHAEGDVINVIDGEGSLFQCKIEQIKKEVLCSVVSEQKNFGAHPYNLTMAVCPTKNIDRYEWFLEKATEMGIDTIVPIIGEHSERKVIKPERLEKILVSAAKQSLKGAVPVLQEQISVKDFIKKQQFSSNTIKLIAYCTNADKVSLKQILDEAAANKNATPEEVADIVILIGPEGDFSPAEVDLALSNGFTPLTLGQSRLRTETAAVFACACVYSSLGE